MSRNGPPLYFPPRSGRYEVAPGLCRFGKALGGGAADQLVFQLDGDYERYRRCKLEARRRRLGKYYQTRELDRPAIAAVTRFIIQRLVHEHPRWFAFEGERLECRLSGDRLVIDDAGYLKEARCAEELNPPPVDALDALACQVQEDLAVMRVEQGRNWLAAVHLCFPNHWAAEDKIGRDFATIHQPVAGMEAINRRGQQMAQLMVDAAEGLVRFAWGITMDDRLDHHPHDPGPRNARFDPSRPRAFLRVERQTIWGFPACGAALFTIRTYLTDCAELRRDEQRRRQLVAAIESMTPASLRYKGLAECRDDLLRWLSFAVQSEHA